MYLLKLLHVFVKVVTYICQGERVPAVPGGHRRGRGRVRRGGGGGGLSLYNKPATTKPLSKETKPNYCNLSFPVKCVQESIKIKPDPKPLS